MCSEITIVFVRVNAHVCMLVIGVRSNSKHGTATCMLMRWERLHHFFSPNMFISMHIQKDTHSPKATVHAREEHEVVMEQR